MTDEFLTEGLRNNRYLKALRLPEQFDDQIEARLKQFDQRMVDAQPEFFDTSDSPSFKAEHNPSSGLAWQRINHPMNGPDAPVGNQKLNVHLYWMEPNRYGRPDINGAVRAFGYKIKNADVDADQEVQSATHNDEWSVETSENPFDDNITFYRHVSSVPEIKDTEETLVEHFKKFGGRYRG
jgi:hypothetical protein